MEQQSNQILTGALERFLTWLDSNGYETYDPYDFWATKYGVFARSLYYRYSKFALPAVAPIVLLDMFFPEARAFIIKKHRYATADTHFIMGFINLYKASSDEKCLLEAERLAGDVEQYSVKGYAGHCWGYPFDWQNTRGLWPKDTPFVTVTPYCFEAYLDLYDLTQKAHYLELAQSIARFVDQDIKDSPYPQGGSAASYSPLDQSMIVNASSYRAFVLTESAFRFNNSEYSLKAKQNIIFILKSQREDGSWFYSASDPADAFIDHFHTCFVLKNLYKIYLRLNDQDVKRALDRGLDYYLKNLFYADGLPKPFALQKREQAVQVSMYDMAEAINLCWLLKDLYPSLKQKAIDLASRTVKEFQTKEGYFVTSLRKGNRKEVFPYLRWPQAQLFHSLTLLNN